MAEFLEKYGGDAEWNRATIASWDAAEAAEAASGGGLAQPGVEEAGSTTPHPRRSHCGTRYMSVPMCGAWHRSPYGNITKAAVYSPADKRKFGAHGEELRQLVMEGNNAMDITTLRAALDDADVAIVNLGIHWNWKQRRHYRLSLDAVLTELTRYNRREQKLALVRETFPQHFLTTDGTGDYSFRRIPVKGTCVRTTNTSNWRNEQLRQAVKVAGFPAANVVPQANLMPLARHDLHPDGADCSHWCYEPHLMEAWLDSIVRHLQGLGPPS